MIDIVSLLGGIFLVLGAIFLARGNVYLSVLTYFIADIMWVLMALTQHAYFSAAVIAFGMGCGLYVWWKINRGDFHKSIKKVQNGE